ncbi:MAG: hypothetical protein ACOCUS_04320, partial [Polyangiales bacterium]
MSRRSSAGLTFVALAAASAVAPVRAAADDALERGVRLAEDADFAGAVEALDVAEQAPELTRDELVSLYGHRAVVRFALGEREAMRADMARLLAVDRDAELPASAPPPVREAWERVRAVPPEPLRIEVDLDTSGETVHLSTRVQGRPSELVRQALLFARAAEGAAWVQGRDGEVRVRATAARGESVQWYAKALGPGGVVIARSGTRANPERVRAGASVATFEAGEPEPANDGAGGGARVAAGAREGRGDGDGSGGDRFKWWLVGGGAAVAV